MDTLIRFTAQNFRSIAEQHSIILSPKKNITDPPLTNVGSNDGVKYLKTIAIYGANSSGKSNWVKAMGRMRSIIVSSNKNNPDEKLPYDPFRLDEISASMPTIFETEFITEGKHYRYGFSFDMKKICGEWLYQITSSGKKRAFFLRDLEGIGVDEVLFPEGNGKEEMTSDNRLFMPLVAQYNGEISKSIFSFFNKSFNIVDGIKTDTLEGYTLKLLKENEPESKEIKRFLIREQLGFSNLEVEQVEFDESLLPQDADKKISGIVDFLKSKLKEGDVVNVKTTHGIYDNEGNLLQTREFEFEDMESEGTKKLFQMTGPIFNTLNEGKIIVIDELDAKMHPLLSQELVRLFNNPVLNPNGAQLIFTTHDTNLLSSGLLRRDQIWFTEKDPQERTDMYCMMQLKLPNGTTPRRDGNMERNYIHGRYGAIPYLTPFNEQ